MCGTVTDLGLVIDANGLRLGGLSGSPLALHLTIETGGEFTLCVNSRAPRGGMYTTDILDPWPLLTLPKIHHSQRNPYMEF